MKTYQLPVSIQAHCEEEARAKLDLFISIGQSFLEMDVDSITTKLFHVHWLEALGKIKQEGAQAKEKQVPRPQVQGANQTPV